MKIREIPRTATFAWSHAGLPETLLATGTVSGALDETFSNVGQLELWDPVVFSRDSSDAAIQPKGSISTNARFNRLAWGSPSDGHGKGVIASGMETGEVDVWDVEKILAGDGENALVFKNETHTGPVRGLDFNPIQRSLFASGATNAELQVFDLNNPSKVHPTGPKSTKLDEITALQWNPIVPHILASSSSSGFTSVWDLKAKKEVISLAYGGGAATGMGGSRGGATSVVGGGMQIGNRRGMSDVCWHPDNSTRLITASEDDTSPIVMLWDLRNSRAPEKILTGHEKGVLSVSWCKQDADLLLSCGKDNRTIAWNPQTCEIVAELPTSQNWSFQTSWCPRNPDLVATASFDGTIGVHSLQSTVEPSAEPTGGRARADSSSIDDIFGGGGGSGSNDVGSAPAISLKQPPKWLRRPVSATFGFGGQLVSTSNLAGASGKHQSGVVHVRHVVTEESVVERARSLADIEGSPEKLGAFCGEMASKSGEDAGWKALQTLFTTNSRDELVSLLGFSKAEIERQVSEAIRNFQPQVADKEEEAVPGTPRDPTVSFAEKAEELSAASASGGAPHGVPSEATPSEMSATTDGTKKTEAETEMTEQSLFGGEDGENAQLGTPHGGDAHSGADFFSSMSSIRTALPDHMVVPHQAVPKDSSVAATIGSRASSVVSESLKVNTFKIYPNDESEVDRLITRALVLGDFDSAVTLSLSVDRFADALILAVKGGPELLARTQQAYFEKRTTALPYLRLFQSIVSNDLSDVVQNADLSEWQEVFVVLCTFAKADEFNSLAEQLGQRLEFQYRVASDGAAAGQFKKHALLCYLAAGKLERVVNIWVDEMREDESREEGEQQKGASRYSTHASALQTFMEKVAIFKSATGYVDRDLADATRSEAVAQAGARTYQLSALYDRYYEYADLLATQGLIELAVTYVKQTPADYKGAKGVDRGFTSARERYLQAAGTRAQAATPKPLQSQAPSNPYAAYAPYQPQQPVAVAPQPAPSAYAPQSSSTYGQYNQPAYASTSAYAPASAPAPAQDYSNAYNPYGAPQQQQQQQTSNYGGQPGPSQPAAPLAPPPRARPDGPTPIPAAMRRDIPGWNDAPNMANKRPTSAAGNKPQPITSPFPQSSTPPAMQHQMSSGGMAAPPPPPPPRGPASIPPPPRNAAPPMRAQPPQQQQQQPMAPPQQARTPGPPPPGRAGPPPGAIAGPPPQRAMTPRVMSPPVQNPPRPPSANPYQAAAPAPPPTAMSPPPPSAPPVQQPANSAPRFPPGDRSHIPPQSRPIFETLAGEIARLRQTTPVSRRVPGVRPATDAPPRFLATTATLPRGHGAATEHSI